jgi:hypothetical protein
MSATKVKRIVLLHGLEEKKVPGIDMLNNLWARTPLFSDKEPSLSSLGQKITGYFPTEQYARTSDKHIWNHRLTFRGLSPGKKNLEVLFPKSFFDPETSRRTIDRSIAFFAPAITSQEVLLTVLERLIEGYSELLQNHGHGLKVVTD